jgi:transposase InsO family protein
VIDAAVAELEPVVGTARACALMGKSRATLYRHRRPVKERPPRPARAPVNALTPSERLRVMDVLHRDDYLDLAVPQVWARELDGGRYHCSMSTMYRLLREHGESRERRRQASHPARVKPELVATSANQVWSWDITMLRGPRRGTYYPLYSIIDIFSRYVPGWLVATVESAELAERMLEQAIACQRIQPGTLTLHADRGGPMTARTVAELLVHLGVTRSHSRPRCSNDNPYVEANYKTLKYCPEFPQRFDSVAQAREFCAWFFNTYNHEHRHSALGWHTPASVHFGTAPEIRVARQHTLNDAYSAHPERFGREPLAPKLPTAAWINQPDKEVIVTR